MFGRFSQVACGAEDEFLLRFQGIGTQAHHGGVEIAAARVEMAAGRGEIDQVHVVHDHSGVRLERVEEQLVKRFFERQRMIFGGGLHEVLHVQKDATDLLVQFLQNRGLAAANSTPQTNNRSDLQAGRQVYPGWRSKTRLPWANFFCPVGASIVPRSLSPLTVQHPATCRSTPRDTPSFMRMLSP